MKHIELTKGLFAKVDDSDYEWLSAFKWTSSDQGKGRFYARRNIRKNGRLIKIYMHREIMQSKNGEICDHKDCDTLNNQRYNLRKCTKAENNRNRGKKKRASSRYIGVTITNSGTWLAQMTHNGHHISIGTFKNETDAALAYNKKKVQLHGEFAQLNKIQ